MIRFGDKYTIDQLRFKVYGYHGYYKGFKELTEERYEELKKEIHEFAKRIRNYDKLGNLGQYIEILGYISHKVEFNHLPYDERIAMLIHECDPSLVHYQQYLTIEKYEGYVQELARNVRSKVGFYDPKFVTYEQALYNKFYKDKMFITGVKEDYSSLLLPLLNKIKNFDSVTDEEYERVIEIAKKWREQFPNEGYLTAFFHATVQGKELGLNGLKEKAIFLIQALDPDLKMLDSYYNNNTVEEIVDDAEVNVGFFAQEFFNLERAYARKYNPEKAEDPWETEIKKTSEI